ncbi:hypothetical protein [Microvirga rosea]|uniref:hypothetical protein n=1 Tax=Microvirga rosea TaxID=2715425 RepID=UPI001D09F100|nr:hypothetical protein [Microvirga rosea]MCB8823312.1 hypothetical protein [Microvirga rosea]
MPLAENYRWGTERPNARIKRLSATSLPNADKDIEKAQLALQRAMAQRDAIVVEIAAVEYTIPDGRYDRDRGNALAAQGYNPYQGAGSAIGDRRSRGRPRKYSAECPPPPRKSRAKTEAGLARAAKGLNRRSPRAPRASALNAAHVSTVTASPSRTPLPKFAPDLGRKLLESTLAGSATIDAIGPADVSLPDIPAGEVTYEQIVDADAPGDSVAEAIRLPATTPKPGDELFAAPPDLPAEMGDGAVAASGGLVLDGGVEPFEPGFLDEIELGTLTIFVEDHHELVFYRRGEDGIACHDYDFSDPMDRSKAKPWLLEMFPMFGLRLSEHLQPPPYQFRRFADLTDDEARAWIDASIELKLSYQMMSYFRRSPLSAKRLVDEYNYVFAKDMWLEQYRRLAWPFIQQRLIDVELLAHRVKQGEMTLEQAKVLFTYQEMGALRAMPGPVQDLYYQIVDAMDWFEGFSPRDLLHWRGLREPGFLFRHRDKDGFARWMYPAHLYDAVRDLTIVDRGFVVSIPMLSDDIVTSAFDVMLWEAIRRSDVCEEEKELARRHFDLSAENPISADAPRLLIAREPDLVERP